MPRPAQRLSGQACRGTSAQFDGFRHGYAGTIYKGQGKTLDHTYLLHTHHWRAAASYVALTRQRESAQVFVAEDTAKDARQLARQMGRGEVRAASVAWATGDELTPELRQRGGKGSAQARRSGKLLRLRLPSQISAPALPIQLALIGARSRTVRFRRRQRSPLRQRSGRAGTAC